MPGASAGLLRDGSEGAGAANLAELPGWHPRPLAGWRGSWQGTGAEVCGSTPAAEHAAAAASIWEASRLVFAWGLRSRGPSSAGACPATRSLAGTGDVRALMGRMGAMAPIGGMAGI